MRLLVFLCALATAGVVTGAAAANDLSSAGFVVYKDLRTHGVVDVRDARTGRVLWTQVDVAGQGAFGGECGDPRHTFFGPRWETFQPYLVNASSIPRYLNGKEALADIAAAHAAWETPFATECAQPAASSPYRALYGGKTRRGPSLVENLAADGANVVAFRSLAGTICDGAIACVVVDYKGSRLGEVDMAFEADLTRYGFEDYWTTDDTTWFDSFGGRFSISDMATHEWGHFAGLGHVNHSPTLTMFPYVHDGMQSLGLGDMRGLLARYPG